MNNHNDIIPEQNDQETIRRTAQAIVDSKVLAHAIARLYPRFQKEKPIQFNHYCEETVKHASLAFATEGVRNDGLTDQTLSNLIHSDLVTFFENQVDPALRMHFKAPFTEASVTKYVVTEYLKEALPPVFAQVNPAFQDVADSNAYLDLRRLHEGTKDWAGYIGGVMKGHMDAVKDKGRA